MSIIIGVYSGSAFYGCWPSTRVLSRSTLAGRHLQLAGGSDFFHVGFVRCISKEPGKQSEFEIGS